MNTISPYIDFARPLYSEKDTGHDFRHIERIIARLEMLSKGLVPAPAKHRLFFLACFHGLGLAINNNYSVAEKTAEFLRNKGWEQCDIDEMFASLLTHLRAPVTPEEMIVHDANYYEQFGAFGIAKAFTVGGARGQSYEETAAIFKQNMNRVVPKTPMGKEIYAKRKAYALAFLDELEKEL